MSTPTLIDITATFQFPGTVDPDSKKVTMTLDELRQFIADAQKAIPPRKRAFPLPKPAKEATVGK